MARKKQVKKEPTKKTPTKKRRKKREKPKGLKIPPPLGPQECNGYKVVKRSTAIDHLIKS